MDEKLVEELADLLDQRAADEHVWTAEEIARQMLAAINASGTHRVIKLVHRERAPFVFEIDPTDGTLSG